jgi:hypothetical protein
VRLVELPCLLRKPYRSFHDFRHRRVRVLSGQSIPGCWLEHVVGRLRMYQVELSSTGAASVSTPPVDLEEPPDLNGPCRLCC